MCLHNTHHNSLSIGKIFYPVSPLKWWRKTVKENGLGIVYSCVSKTLYNTTKGVYVLPLITIIKHKRKKEKTSNLQ
jgi:hypothetical protein